MSKEVLGDNIVAAWAKFQTGQMAMQPLSWPIAIADMEDRSHGPDHGRTGNELVLGEAQSAEG